MRAPIAASIGAGLLVLTAACGIDVQTLQPYTPAEGVNFDVGNSRGPTRRSTSATC